MALSPRRRPSRGCKFWESLNGRIGQARQDASQIFPDEDPHPGISGWRPAWLGRYVHSATPRTYTHGLGGGAAIAPSAAPVNPVVPLTHTLGDHGKPGIAHPYSRPQ